MCSFAPVYTVNEKLPLVFICLFVLSVWCTEFFLKMPSRLFYIYICIQPAQAAVANTINLVAQTTEIYFSQSGG